MTMTKVANEDRSWLWATLLLLLQLCNERLIDQHDDSIFW